jgi:hypothetical protein
LIQPLHTDTLGKGGTKQHFCAAHLNMKGAAPGCTSQDLQHLSRSEAKGAQALHLVLATLHRQNDGWLARLELIELHGDVLNENDSHLIPAEVLNDMI